VKLISDGSDSGIIINRNKKNKSVSVYWNGIGMTSVTKLNKFDVSKL
jgi:HSP90 family molecular chaperone